MIEIYYTGAGKYLGDQPDPAKSLGGYIACSKVPNNYLNNLFGVLNNYTLQEGLDEYRVIAIKNSGSSVLSGLNAYVTHEAENKANLEIGYATYTIDDDGRLSSETLPNKNAAPYNVTITPHTGAGNALSLPSLSPGTYLAIYIKRTIPTESQDPISDDDLEAILDGDITLTKKETPTITFDWS